MPNRYILILADPPVGVRYPTRASLAEAGARNYRAQVEQRQTNLLAELSRRNITAVGSVSTLLNAVFVVAPPERLDELKALPGVIGVLRSRRGKAFLNSATQLMKAPDAWALPAIGGQQNAGKGIKIAIMDSGIDQNHPAFQDPSLPAAGGKYPICTTGHPEDCAFTNNKVIVARSYVRQIAGFQYAAPPNLNTITGPPDPATSQPDDYSPRDRMGHGTAVASCAAANSTTTGTVAIGGGVVTISGMAPKAYLGNYKIAGSPGVNDNPPDDVWIQAVEDALNDGMDVLNMSWGAIAAYGPLDTGAACGEAPGVPCDAVAYAFETAAQQGLVIVSAAGNDGTVSDAWNPNAVYNTIASPANAPSVLAVGATLTSHSLWPTVSVAGPSAPSNLQNIKAYPSDSYLYGYYGALQAPLVDVSTIGDGYACSGFPAGWLRGKFALVQRGPTGANACAFSTKAANVQDAGATGMIVYNSADSPALPNNNTTVEGVDAFIGPVVGLTNSAGVTLKSYLAANPKATVTIDLSGVEQIPDAAANQLASYSSLGPGLAAFPACATCRDLSVKPDLVAAGGGDPWLFPDPSDNALYGFPGMLMATQKYDPMGVLYGANGYASANGTSFASPLVAGAAALVKQAHPTWTAAQIRSALVNWSNAQAVTTSDFNDALDIRWTGAGLLDAAAAVKATVAAVPATVSFGALKPGASLPPAQALTITNLGSSAVTLSVAVAPQSGHSATGATVAVDKQTLNLGVGASATLNVSLTGAVPAAGSYSGNINLTATDVAMHIPYLFLVGSGSVGSNGNIVPISSTSVEGFPNTDVGALAVQLLDANGAPVTGAPVTFTKRSGVSVTLRSAGGGEPSCSPDSSPSSVTCNTDSYGIAYVDLLLGSTPGNTSITLTATGISPTYPTFSVNVRLAPSTGGVSDSAKGKTPIAPGSYVSIYGVNLSDVTDVETTTTLPLSLDGVTVSFDVPSAGISVPGYLVFVSPNQVNVQAPWELQGLPSGTKAQMKVTLSESEYGTVFSVPVADVSPSFFEVPSGSGNVAALVANTDTVIGASRPAKKGEIVQLYANGLGPVDNPPASGEPASLTALVHTKNDCAVTIGGQTSTVSFCGLTPGLPGLYQINALIPANAASGSQTVVLSVGGQTATSNILIQ